MRTGLATLLRLKSRVRGFHRSLFSHHRTSNARVFFCFVCFIVSNVLFLRFFVVPPPLPAAGDIDLMNDLLKDLEDPETLKEVEKLMKARL